MPSFKHGVVTAPCGIGRVELSLLLRDFPRPIELVDVKDGGGTRMTALRTWGLTHA